MTVTDFQREIRENGAYETPVDAHRSVSDRLLGRFDAWYYVKVLACLIRGYVAARRGLLDADRWAKYAHVMLRAAESCGGRAQIAGAANISRPEQAAVVVANHMSMLETMVLPAVVLPLRPMAFVLKKELLEYPMFGTIIRNLKHIPVSRTMPRSDLKNVMIAGADFLRSGCSVAVFPQSTRSSRFNPADFNSLGVKLAERAGAPVIPLALKTDFQATGRLLRDFGRIDRNMIIRFEFGPPIAVNGNPKAAHASSVRFIVDRLRKWGADIVETED